ncbi:MAG: AraC family transcriptional regulator [Bacteroidales bacterium]|nr:AraC family transcriptional regulator [Bacteroidales bacterium]
MDYQIIQPPPQLADYIRLFWYLEFNATEDKPFVHRAFAHHCFEIVFCYKGQFKFQAAFDRENNLGSGVYGQTQSISKVTSNTNFGVLGIYLYPYALTQLFGVPASEITNQSVDVQTLFGKQGKELEERIMMALDNKQRIKIISNFFESQLKNIKSEFSTLCSSVKTISNAYSTLTVNILASNNFLSVRQFERRFKEFSGFSPKLFLRIARFNSLLNKSYYDKPFAEIAFDFGYYDEAHFSHDFKELSGISPKEYFKPETLAAIDRGIVILSW